MIIVKAIPALSCGTMVTKGIERLKDELDNTMYGEVGIIFTVHNGEIVGIKDVIERKYLTK